MDCAAAAAWGMEATKVNNTERFDYTQRYKKHRIPIRFYLVSGFDFKNNRKARAIIKLVYKAARDRSIIPAHILICHVNCTTGGKNNRKPDSPHITSSYKTAPQVQSGRHVACHAYIETPLDLTFSWASLGEEKDDTIPNESWATSDERK
ncbi:hypothetical protein NX059_007862 [Plenodomus lindquistii]|nr:hypothetical protein NX059_007862 [Plenodomus lindquistii]